MHCSYVSPWTCTVDIQVDIQVSTSGKYSYVQNTVRGGWERYMVKERESKIANRQRRPWCCGQYDTLLPQLPTLLQLWCVWGGGLGLTGEVHFRIILLGTIYCCSCLCTVKTVVRIQLQFDFQKQKSSINLQLSGIIEKNKQNVSSKTIKDNKEISITFIFFAPYCALWILFNLGS
jgi:hypothetical protein